MQDLRIIDALGPFILGDTKYISNWSKIPFEGLEQQNQVDKKKREKILIRFESYIKNVSRLGYNAISIDGLEHIVIHDFYTPSLKKLLSEYQVLYKQLFNVAIKYHCKVFMNTDYMFYNKEIDDYTKKKNKNIQKLFFTTIEKMLQQYPGVSGIIVRIGESDAQNVQDHFLSRLTLRTPKQANQLLKTVLPLFEKHNKTLIFRTWTVGVYKIGDLIWNKRTFDAVFSSITSDNLIISMKYGDTDFLRYLSLNPLFFHGSHKKIIELQTKREWEGMGLYPSFVGWEYADYLDKLRSNKYIVGIHVWCQTGGWMRSGRRQITFLDNSSFWNELNTYVAVKLYTEKKSVESIVTDFCRARKIKDNNAFIQLLMLSEVAIKNGLYVKEFASKTLYFRRVRIPSLSWIAWDEILVNPLTKSLLLYIVKDTDSALKEGMVAIDAIKEMLHIGKRIGLETSIIHSLQFELETFIILAHIRKLLFASPSKSEKTMIKKQIAVYEKKYPEHYSASISIWKHETKKTKKATIAFHVTLRFLSAYRRIDKFSLSITPIQKCIIKWYMKRFAPFLSTQAMGVDVLFK